MLRVMRNEKVMDARRDDMAKAAAAYLHTKLSSIPSELEDELGPAPNEPVGAAEPGGEGSV